MQTLDYYTIDGALGWSQDWFRDWWMHLGGCAAVTACDCNILLARDHGLAALYPHDPQLVTRQDYERYAMTMKPYLRPRRTGIDRLSIYLEGITRLLARPRYLFAARRRASWRCALGGGVGSRAAADRSESAGAVSAPASQGQNLRRFSVALVQSRWLRRARRCASCARSDLCPRILARSASALEHRPRAEGRADLFSEELGVSRFAAERAALARSEELFYRMIDARGYA